MSEIIQAFAEQHLKQADAWLESATYGKLPERFPRTTIKNPQIYQPPQIATAVFPSEKTKSQETISEPSVKNEIKTEAAWKKQLLAGLAAAGITLGGVAGVNELTNDNKPTIPVEDSTSESTSRETVILSNAEGNSGDLIRYLREQGYNYPPGVPSDKEK